MIDGIERSPLDTVSEFLLEGAFEHVVMGEEENWVGLCVCGEPLSPSGDSIRVLLGNGFGEYGVEFSAYCSWPCVALIALKVVDGSETTYAPRQREALLEWMETE